MSCMGAFPSSFSPLMLMASIALLLLPWAALPVTAISCDAGNKKILLSLKQSLGNPTLLSSWKEDTDCCASWNQIECNGDGWISMLNLQSINTPGTIPPSIGGLTDLQDLTIRKCNLSGPIPSEIGRLKFLSVLRLQRNGLTGSIPDSIGMMSNLVFLSLSHNKLSGQIPASLSRLHNVADLYLDDNLLTGPVPSSLANLDPKHVNISINKLSGDVSALITAWTSAQTIDISNNAFRFDLGTVQFPAGLTIFNMAVNGIYGTIPRGADGMKGLKQFDVSGNRLCGHVPQGGVVCSFPKASFSGNTCLCGSPMTSCLQLNCALICVRTGSEPSASSSSRVQVSR